MRQVRRGLAGGTGRRVRTCRRRWVEQTQLAADADEEFLERVLTWVAGQQRPRYRLSVSEVSELIGRVGCSDRPLLGLPGLLYERLHRAEGGRCCRRRRSWRRRRSRARRRDDQRGNRRHLRGLAVGRAGGGAAVLVGCGGTAVGKDTVGCGVAVSVPSARKVIPSQPMANPSTLITNARNTSKTWSPPRQGRTTRASMTNPPPRTMTPTTIASKLGIDISTYHNVRAARMFHLPQRYAPAPPCQRQTEPPYQHLPGARGGHCAFLSAGPVFSGK